ncbi:MAG TPA: 4Fe-4S binding protein [Rectinemataceae bacterium]
MTTRNIIEINQDLCDGCGACETGCPEGALKVIGGKARLVGESLCDGLGACLGRCPRGAIKVTRRHAEEYDEAAVIDGMIPQGEAVLAAHFAHLDHHGQDLYLRQAAARLRALGMSLPPGYESLREPEKPRFAKPCSSFALKKEASRPAIASALGNWPVQLHLSNPRAPGFDGAHLLLAADCTAFASGSFHEDFIRGRATVIACPKLDHGRDVYIDKLTSLVAKASSVTVVTMEVPCCSGLVSMALEARSGAESDIPIDHVVIGIDGAVVSRRKL